jgi:hypothetical protein
MAVRHRNTHELLNPDKNQRDSGTFPLDYPGGGAGIPGIIGTMPICAAAACDLSSDIGRDETELILRQTKRDRNCPKFTDCIPGLSPKEHIYMNTLDSIIKRQEHHHKVQIWILGFFVGICTLAVAVCTIVAPIIAKH